MPVGQHLDLLVTQFLASALRRSHLSHGIVTAPPAARPHMKPSLRTTYSPALEPYLHEGVITEINYKPTLTALHTTATKAAIQSLQPN
jgi:hypothetical protein